jgi:Na+-transporting NADH:ubiquinone oxidoreductase subunit NqrA
MSEDQLRQNKYDVKTLAYLTQHEVKDGAFAHLCKYSFEKPANSEQKDKEKSGYYADPYNIPSE